MREHCQQGLLVPDTGARKLAYERRFYLHIFTRVDQKAQIVRQHRPLGLPDFRDETL